MTPNSTNDSATVRWGIKWKLILIITILIVSLVVLLSYIQVSSQKRSLEIELSSRISLMRENLIERAKSFIIALSQQLENDIAAFNFSGATAAIADSVIKNKEIKYAILMDAAGKAIIHTQRPDLTQTELIGARDREALTQKKLTVVPYREGEEQVIEIINPIQISATPWGYLRVVYSLKLLEDEISAIRKQMQSEINIMIYRSVLTSLGILGLGLIAVFILSTRITKPIIYLTESARKLSKGDFSAFADVDTSSRDEVGILGKTFIEMSEKLKDSYKELEDYSKTLEEKVAARTSDLEKALNDTAQARDRIDGIVKSVADGLIVTDIYNRVILMNRTAEDLLGVRLSEVIDRPIDFAIQDETLRARVRSTLQKKREGYEFDFELPGDDPKHPRIMRARTSVIADKEGKQTGIVTIIHDVTHEREVDRMKTEFISTAAHELRTPLTSIQGFSEIMLTRSDITEEEKKRFLSYINKQSVSLTLIVSDLLDIARIESGRGFALNKASYDISDTIRQVIPYFQEHSPQHHFELSIPDQPLVLQADRQKMEQVFKNLIGNAVKYSARGGVIRVTGGITDDHFEAAVADNGIGMSTDQVEKIFDKFYRADASDTAIEGTGLGMTIVKHIVEAHGGRIWVESELGKGTTVRFTIPT
ncbi:PAS domain S-box protein [bacterium]|nr:PAS domain S-box protein [candidate division CSSED10-310 bacterium]